MKFWSKVQNSKIWCCIGLEGIAEETTEDEEDDEDKEDEGHKASTTSSFMLPLGHRKRRRRAAVRVRHDRIYGSAAKARRHGRVLHCMQAVFHGRRGAQDIFVSKDPPIVSSVSVAPPRYLPYQAPQDTMTTFLFYQNVSFVLETANQRICSGS